MRLRGEDFSKRLDGFSDDTIKASELPALRQEYQEKAKWMMERLEKMGVDAEIILLALSDESFDSSLALLENNPKMEKEEFLHLMDLDDMEDDLESYLEKTQISPELKDKVLSVLNRKSRMDWRETCADNLLHILQESENEADAMTAIDHFQSVFFTPEEELYIACVSGYGEIEYVESLLKKGISPNAKIWDLGEMDLYTGIVEAEGYYAERLQELTNLLLRYGLDPKYVG